VIEIIEKVEQVKIMLIKTLSPFKMFLNIKNSMNKKLA
jgi:hypothetical protein